MKKLIGFVALVAGCIPQPSQSTYRVNEIQLLFPEASERWSYFYGEPQPLKLGDRSLVLEQKELNGIWTVKNTLAVNGETVLREISPAKGPVAQTARIFPGLQLVVKTNQAIQNAWLYDGSWSRLGEKSLEAGRSELLDTRFGSPTFVALSQAETEVVLREILARRTNRPVVIYEVDSFLAANLYQPSPTRYESTAIAVQYGLETELTVRSSAQPPKILLQGAYAAYTANTSAAYLASDQGQLDSIWRTATRNQLPAPNPPSVSFGQNRVAAFFWGQKNTGGYSVQFVRAETSGSTVRATLNLISPAPGAITTQALTSPFIILQISGTPGRVEFVDGTGKVLASAGN